MLTYLLAKKELTPQEVAGVAIDIVGAGVDTVSKSPYLMTYNHHVKSNLLWANLCLLHYNLFGGCFKCL